MQRVAEVMTRQVRSIPMEASLQQAAQIMSELDVGAIPVCDGEQLVGMVTDRDIAVRGVSAGKMPGEASVREVMSSEVAWCFEDQPLDEVMRQMADTQVRRIPVVSHDEARRLVGIVALGDLATRASQDAQAGTEQVVENVSQPSAPDQPSAAPGKADPSDEGRYSGFAHKDLASMAPVKGSSAGPGSTHDIGAAAAAGLGTAATGAGNMVNTGGTATPTHTSSPARNLEDAAGGPSSPPRPTLRQDQEPER